MTPPSEYKTPLFQVGLPVIRSCTCTTPIIRCIYRITHRLLKTLLLFAGAAYFVSYIYGQLMETKQWSKEKCVLAILLWQAMTSSNLVRTKFPALH